MTSKRLSGFDLERFAQDVPWVEDTKTWNKISKVWLSFRKEWSRLETQLERRVFKLKIGDAGPLGEVDTKVRNVKGYSLDFSTPTNLFYWNFIKNEISRNEKLGTNKNQL